MGVHLRAHDVSLELPLNLQRGRADAGGRFMSALGGSIKRYVKVLSRIEFAAHEGDRIALMGLNGAGKTTLLRVLNGAFEPTTGSVSSSGTMQSLLNPGLGFSDYATVAENVVLRGTAMGLRRDQLRAAMNDILDFSGLRDRASHRLGTLSAGQRTRLGFAISTAVQPDILLMDEWIATGDAAFVQRAQERMHDRFRGSRVVVLASHGTDLQRRLCNKALVLDAGKLRYFGDIAEGLALYRDIVAGASASLRESSAMHDPLLYGDVHGFVERIRLLDRGVEVEGWAIGDRGREAEALHVDVGDLRYVVNEFDRVARDDVLRVTSRKTGRYGFRFVLPQVDVADPGSFAAHLRISIGDARNRASHPLQMAIGAVVEAV